MSLTSTAVSNMRSCIIIMTNVWLLMYCFTPDEVRCHLIDLHTTTTAEQEELHGCRHTVYGYPTYLSVLLRPHLFRSAYTKSCHRQSP